MPPIELHVDTTATTDVAIHPSSFPPDTVAGDLIAIRPVLRPGSKGKAKDRPLLFKVDKTPDLDELAAAAASDGPAGLAARRRGKAQVTVSPVVAQGFSWVKNRIEVELSLVRPPRLSLSLTLPPPPRSPPPHLPALLAPADPVTASSAPVRLARRALLQQPVPVAPGRLCPVARPHRQGAPRRPARRPPRLGRPPARRRHVVGHPGRLGSVDQARLILVAVVVARQEHAPRGGVHHRRHQVRVPVRVGARLHLCRGVARAVAV